MEVVLYNFPATEPGLPTLIETLQSFLHGVSDILRYRTRDVPLALGQLLWSTISTLITIAISQTVSPGSFATLLARASEWVSVASAPIQTTQHKLTDMLHWTTVQTHEVLEIANQTCSFTISPALCLRWLRWVVASFFNQTRIWLSVAFLFAIFRFIRRFGSKRASKPTKDPSNAPQVIYIHHYFPPLLGTTNVNQPVSPSTTSSAPRSWFSFFRFPQIRRRAASPFSANTRKPAIIDLNCQFPIVTDYPVADLDFSQDTTRLFQQLLPLYRGRLFNWQSALQHRGPGTPSVVHHLFGKGPFDTLHDFSLAIMRFTHPRDHYRRIRQSVQSLTSIEPITSMGALTQFLETYADFHPFLAFVPLNHILYYTLTYGALSKLHHRDSLMVLAERCANFSDYCALLRTGDLHTLFRHIDRPHRPLTRAHPRPRTPRPTTETRTLTHQKKQPQVITGYHSVLSTPPDSRLPHHPLIFNTANLEVEALCDTCASTSIISQNLVHRLGGTIFIDPDNPEISLSTAYSDIQLPHRLVNFTFHLAGIDTAYSHTFFVTPKSDLLILGWDFFSSYGYSIPLQLPTPSPEPYTATITSLLAAYQPGPLTLPPRRSTDYQLIYERPRSTIRPRPLMNLPLADQTFLDAEVDRLLKLGFISEIAPSNHYAVAFVANEHGRKPRMVIDYRPLNAITQTLPAHIDSFASLMVDVHGSILSTLDLSQAYHHLRLHPSTAQDTVFRTKRGFYHWNVLPFGLANSPEVFCRFVRQLLEPHAAYSRAYLDDILIFSSSSEEHTRHLAAILTTLSNNQLHLNVDKSSLFQTEVDWVGHHLVASSTGVKLHPQDHTVEIIRHFTPPASIADVRSFIGHLAYINEYIPNFAERLAPLSALMVKHSKFAWTSECQETFNALIDLELATLRPFRSDRPIKLQTDASAVAVGAVLYQPDDDNLWSPVEYRSYKFNKFQINWPTVEKELFAIRFATRKFNFYIAGRPSILLETDHRAAVDIFAADNLTPKQARWLADLIPFNLTISHIPGLTNVTADFLSRPPHDKSTLSGSSSTSSSPLSSTSSLTASSPDSSSSSTSPVQLTALYASVAASPDWLQSFIAGYHQDPFFAPIIANPSSPYSLDSLGRLWKDTKLCIPHQHIQQLLDLSHADTLAGHLGKDRMLTGLRSQFFFPRLEPTVVHYVESCVVCKRVKSRNRTLGLLQTPIAPTGRWESIAVDVVSGFTQTTYFAVPVDSVLVVVDLFSSRCHFYPVASTFSALDFVDILVKFYFPLHGFPKSIHSDRGLQFANQLLTSLAHNLGFTQHLSVTDHHASNGKAERLIRTLQDYLRLYITENQKWVHYLPTAEYVLNASPSVSLAGHTPFAIDLGYTPSAPADMLYSINEEGRVADDITEILDRQAKTARAAINHIHQVNKNYFDAKHTEVEFEEGDVVYIDQNLHSAADVHNKSVAKAFRGKFVGPFKITKKLSPVNYVLDLPSSSKRDSPFHISQLKGQKKLPPGFFSAPEATAQMFKKYKDGSVEVELKSILGHRKKAKGYVLEVEFVDGTTDYIQASSLKRTASELLSNYAKRFKELQHLA